MSIADLFVPNPYPINVSAIATPSITTNALTVNGNPAVAPVLINSAPSSLLEINFHDTTPNDAFMGLNGLEALPSAYVFGGPGVGAKIGTNGAERLRILSAGITANENATQALVQAVGSTILTSRTLDQGRYIPVGAIVSGFSIFGAITGLYSVNGNMVTASVVINTTATSIGSNTATISLPAAPLANFTLSTQLIGTASSVPAAGTATSSVVANTGSSLALLTLNASNATSCIIALSFQYQIQ
jgi:hypothetical protein